MQSFIKKFYQIIVIMAESKTKKDWYKRWWAITIFIFIGLITLGSLFGSNDNPTTNTQTNQDVNNNIQEEARAYQLGDVIQAGDFKWKITEVSTTSEIGQDIAGSFFGEKADGIFVIIDVEIENTANSAEYLTDSYIKLVDNQGREFSPNTLAAIYLKPEGSALAFEQINPGITKKGKIVYDVPEGINNFNVKITSSLFSSEVYNVAINI